MANEIKIISESAKSLLEKRDNAATYHILCENNVRFIGISEKDIKELKDIFFEKTQTHINMGTKRTLN